MSSENKYPTTEDIKAAKTTEEKLDIVAKMFVLSADTFKVISQTIDENKTEIERCQKVITHLYNKMSRYEGVEESIRRAITSTTAAEAVQESTPEARSQFVDELCEEADKEEDDKEERDLRRRMEEENV